MNFPSLIFLNAYLLDMWITLKKNQEWIFICAITIFFVENIMSRTFVKYVVFHIICPLGCKSVYDFQGVIICILFYNHLLGHFCKWYFNPSKIK
jgi:hypothetical protein